MSYGYSTNSVYSPASGWTSTGSASATASGAASSSFSASTPYSASGGDGLTNGGSIPGTAAGSGSDWSSYRYTETETLGPGGWSQPGGTGVASGNTSASWSYSGNGGFWASADGGTVSGTLGDSGSESFSLGYNTAATLDSGTGAWVQSGSGSVAASSLDNYCYSGSGSGVTDGTNSPGYVPNVSWSLNEHGSGSGTGNYSDALTLGSNGAWAHQAGFSSTAMDESLYTYNASGSSGDTTNGQSWTTTVNDDEITSATGNYQNGVGPPRRTAAAAR